MTELESRVSNVERKYMGAPRITGAYASLINSDLHDDLSPTRSNSHLEHKRGIMNPADSLFQQ
jgi:hypothetical protein